MNKIIAFSGSNSKESINQKLVKYASGFVTEASVSVVNLRDYELPLYGIDLENEEGIPENALKLKKLFDENDGFIIALPEHNTSITAFFKNTIDWLSRIHMSFFEHKPIVLLATSPGPGGGRNALAHGEKILSGYMSGKVIGTQFVPQFHQTTSVNANGEIIVIDEEIAENIEQLVKKLEGSMKTVVSA